MIASMKLLVGLIFSAAAISVCHGLRLPFNSWKLSDGEEDCKGKTFGCASCTSSRICKPTEDGSQIWYQDTNCPKDRPYCDPDSGSCVNKETSNCGTESDFICLQKERYIPSEDCHAFYYCDESYKAQKFQCQPAEKVYDPTTHSCQDASKASCGTYTCDDAVGKKVKHGVFESFYALCLSEEDKNIPLVINVCNDGYILNTTSQLCEPNCFKKPNINIEDFDNCENYYHCKQVVFPGDEEFYLAEKFSCPEGEAYDPTTFMCADKSTVTTCKPT